MQTLNCFKAYDILVAAQDELNEEIAYRIGRAYVNLPNQKPLWWGMFAHQ